MKDVHRFYVVLIYLLFALPSAASTPPAGGGVDGVETGGGSAAVPGSQLPRSDLFTFHSDAFVNVHHFLYRWGQVGPGTDGAAPGARVVLAGDELERYATMDEADRDAWDFAASYYRLDMVGRDLLFDEQMVALRDCLVLAGNFCDRIAARDQASLDILNAVMPVYRRVFWSRHNAENRRWIDQVMPLAQRFEGVIAPRLAAAYGGEWSEQRNRVDVTAYANDVGAYTTADGHITLSSTLPGTQGLFGLELLFHEASHGNDLERPLHALIGRAFAAIEAEPPPDLWHMTIFYTAGHLTRAALAEAGIDYPQTYAEYAGIFTRREANVRARAALEPHWPAALEAGTGFEPAMREVARAWQAEGG